MQCVGNTHSTHFPLFGKHTGKEPEQSVSLEHFISAFVLLVVLIANTIVKKLYRTDFLILNFIFINYQLAKLTINFETYFYLNFFTQTNTKKKFKILFNKITIVFTYIYILIFYKYFI